MFGPRLPGDLSSLCAAVRCTDPLLADLLERAILRRLSTDAEAWRGWAYHHLKTLLEDEDARKELDKLLDGRGPEKG